MSPATAISEAPAGALTPERVALDRDGVFVVIAAYNEAQVIGEVVSRVRDCYPRVVVVDDGSRDATAEQATRAGAEVLRHVINRGQGAALQTGIEHSLRRGARVIVTFDADGQHRVEDIDRLVAPIAGGEVEVTIGSRFLEGGRSVPVGRRLLLWCATWFTRLTSGARVTDAHNGLRALSRASAEKLDLKLDRMAHASEIIDQILQMRMSLREVPVHVRYTEYSMSKGQRSSAALRIAFEYLWGKLFG